MRRGSAPLFLSTLAVLLLALASADEESLQSAEQIADDTVVLSRSIKFTSGQEAAAEMLRSQDPAIASVIFAERHGIEDVDSVLSLANMFAQDAAAISHEAPASLLLRTAGAYKKKAAELAKDGEHDQAAAHLIRALLPPAARVVPSPASGALVLREGLDETTVADLKQLLATAMQKLKQQRMLEAQEAREAAAAEARRVEEALALQEARARAARDEADWSAYLQASMDDDRLLVEAKPSPALFELELQLRGPANDGSGVLTKKLVVRNSHEDGPHAVYEFCSAHGLHSADEVRKLSEIVQARMTGSPVWLAEWLAARPSTSPPELLRRAGEHRSAASFREAGVLYTRLLAHPDGATLSSEEVKTAREGVVQMMVAERALLPFFTSVRTEQWQAALDALERLPRDQRSSARLQLLEARCHQMLGRWGSAQRAAARVVEATATYSPWLRGQPRMLAVALGSAAALEQGDGKKALSFLASVLKYDPDQEEVRTQYKQLKAVLQLMASAEEQVVKGYNHRAVAELDTVLAKLRGMDVGNTLLRAQVLLKLCRARSAMKKHVEAMEDCQTAYSALSTPGPGVQVHPARVREALEARAVAHEADQNFDEAVADLRAASELSSGPGAPKEAAQALEGNLRRVLELQRKWRCIDPSDQKAWHDNRCGHAGDPNSGRNHRSVLELPANLGDLKPEDQCSWVIKQYRKLAKQWHPDRYKGLKARAERKMRECSEAKEVLFKQLTCSEGSSKRRGRA